MELSSSRGICAEGCEGTEEVWGGACYRHASMHEYCSSLSTPSSDQRLTRNNDFFPWRMGCFLILDELHADLFSRYASPLEVCVFMAVNESGEDVLSDEVCR